MPNDILSMQLSLQFQLFNKDMAAHKHKAKFLIIVFSEIVFFIDSTAHIK